jgi:hypothetical protein
VQEDEPAVVVTVVAPSRVTLSMISIRSILMGEILPVYSPLQTLMSSQQSRSYSDYGVSVTCRFGARGLTAFDVPCTQTMYPDMSLAGHHPRQAIVRANRVHGDKPGGLTVNMINLADNLADAGAGRVRA